MLYCLDGTRQDQTRDKKPHIPADKATHEKGLEGVEGEVMRGRLGVKG